MSDAFSGLLYLADLAGLALAPDVLCYRSERLQEGAVGDGWVDLGAYLVVDAAIWR